MPNHAQIAPVILEVGKFLRSEFLKFKTESIENKGLNDLVSYVDKTAEKMLVDGFLPLIPNAGFILEENTVAYNKADYEWIIDPLDGTTNFVHGLPMFSISVALYHMGLPIYGAVYLPMYEEYFYADASGAYLNDNKISINANKPLKDSLVATGFPYTDFKKLPEYLQILGHLMQTTHGVRRMGSAAIDLAYTACGRFDVFFEYNLKPWDVAAGAFIVQQAGGVVSEFNGGNDYVFGKSILAGNSIIQKEMLGVLEGF